MMTAVEIFKPGRHQAMSGQLLDFSADDLAATAAAYDPALHEAPVVVGHPEHDKPAYGWIKGVAMKDGRLVAELGDVDPDFADLVKARRFAKVSASFYTPGASTNPKPGTWYLRHVGFLGAQPPSVKGLKPVQFADGDDGSIAPGVVTFAADRDTASDRVSTAAPGAASALPDRIDTGDTAAVAAAAQAFQAQQAELGNPITIAAAVEAVRRRDPAHVGREAADFQEELGRHGIVITTADAVAAVTRDPAGAARQVSELRSAAQARETARIHANADLAVGYQEACAAAGVRISIVEAVTAIRAASDRASAFADATGDPERVSRASLLHQERLKKLGINITIGQAVVEVRDQLGVGRSKDPLDPENLLRSAETVGLSREQLVREAKKLQADWQRMGRRKTLFEAAWLVINDHRERQANEPMTSEELKAANFSELDAQAIADAAEAFREAQSARGIVVTTAAAVRHVMGT